MEKNIQDNTLIQKEDLIQKEISDKGFDQSIFIKFCSSKKPNGDSLVNWSLEELKGIVEEFLKAQESEETKTDSPEKTSDGEVEVEPELPKKKEVIICKKMPKTELNDKEVAVKVEAPKDIEKWKSSKTYALYNITTAPLGWRVQRGFSDFDSLRKALVKAFPAKNIPPLPGKKLGSRRVDAGFVKKRVTHLGNFINKICQIEDFKASEVLVTFLSCDEKEKYDNKMKEFCMKAPTQSVEDFQTIDGKVEIAHDEGFDNYFININKFFKFQKEAMIKLNHNLKLFYTNMSYAANNLNDARKNFEDLAILNTKVMMKSQITKTYEKFGFFCKNWNKILTRQNILVKEYIKKFFKYIWLEDDAFFSITKEREEIKDKYMTELTKINQKKEKIFSTKDIKKFEISPDNNNFDKEKILVDKKYAFDMMCFKDNQSLKKIREQLGYYNRNCIQELKKLLKSQCERFISNLKAFDGLLYPTLNDEILTWTNLENYAKSASLKIKKREGK